MSAKDKPAAKRAFEKAEAAAIDTGFGVRLDGRMVRTPARAKLIVPTLALAQDLAAEWAAQGEHIIPETMPINRIVHGAIDLLSQNRDGVIAQLVTYADTDLLCYRAERPDDLVQRQARAFDPWLDWAAEVFGARLKATDGVIAVRQDEPSLTRLKAAVREHRDFPLAGLHHAVTLTGSLVLGLAMARRALGGEEAAALATVDERFQIERWGDDPVAAQKRARQERDLIAVAAYFAALA